MKAKDPEKVDISLFNWCGTIITSKDKLSHELHSLQTSLREKGAQIKKLEDSLSELVTLKEQHDNALMEKFSLLLNEKKAKIRDQQRLLTSSTIDETKLEELESQRKSRSRSAGPSRARKRKVGAVVESDSDDGFEKMEVDEANESANNSEVEEIKEEIEDDRRTESTASEASDDDDNGPPPPPRRTINQERASKELIPAAAPPEEVVLPPRRELPFQKKPAIKSPPKPVQGSSETDSDDEL